MIEAADFGGTGHRSSRVIFGAAGLGKVPQERADEVLPILLEFGVNHLDTAASYGDSELRLAPWLATHRDEFFLATKTGDRDGAGARASLERSLTRMGVDHVDLVQLHNLVEPEEWEQAHAPGGAVEALARARDEGLTRFLGVTGHGLRIAGMHLRSLERFEFDSVLMPYNYTLLANAAVPGRRRSPPGTLRPPARGRPEHQIGGAAAVVARNRRTADTAGTSHCLTARPSVAPSGSCSETPSCSSTRPVTSACSDPSSKPPRAGGPPPTDEDLERDAADLEMAPLFDGSELERI